MTLVPVCNPLLATLGHARRDSSSFAWLSPALSAEGSDPTALDRLADGMIPHRNTWQSCACALEGPSDSSRAARSRHSAGDTRTCFNARCRLLFLCRCALARISSVWPFPTTLAVAKAGPEQAGRQQQAKEISSTPPTARIVLQDQSASGADQPSNPETLAQRRRALRALRSEHYLGHPMQSSSRRSSLAMESIQKQDSVTAAIGNAQSLPTTTHHGQNTTAGIQPKRQGGKAVKR
ncbi:hypothetical protein BD289DRAFT_104649 [Coniella lustricola]|uniref:Uncharacterized protein n=1 Tax=Coniella lustricola TaxID=2025994 RepID=A0A2T2ZXX1_9PEZI|nr:hypothetical protein BD289DRAFT_104649 [Coniella lustricola]